MTVIDTLKLSRALRAAGMAPEQAEAVSAALNDAFTSQVAEKRDLDEVQSDLGARIEAVRTELGARIEAVRTELKHEIEALRAEFGARLTFQQWQLGAIFAVLVGLLIKLVVFHP
ncbi:MAG TPA: hypothetical protein VFQ82_07805 [Stellaceae bacterium]|jgi:hypothetical protein|nr:hypothetical protein [Stellaceae bacterium]